MNRNRKARMDQLQILINETEGKLKGYIDELKQHMDDRVKTIRRLKDTVELAGYVVINFELDNYDLLELTLSESTRFKNKNYHTVQRKLNRLNLRIIACSHKTDEHGRYERDSTGEYTGVIEKIVVDWAKGMTKQDVQHQCIELGIELPEMSNDKIRSLRFALGA